MTIDSGGSYRGEASVQLLARATVPGCEAASEVSKAAAFYEEQVPALGWTPLEQPTVNASTEFLGFARAGQVMSVIITSGEAGTRVHITLTRTQQ